MPIMQCTLPEGGQGWKWGQSGHCYPTRDEAERQAAGACANGYAGDSMAFDRASVRSVDADGRMHVSETNISKANVCPYLGREIPNWQGLGLEPDKIYYLLRDPEELEKGASTFNNLPLLARHVPVTVDDHHPDLVIGSTGTDTVFEAPFLKNSLVIWTKPAIDGVNNESQKEISCGYRYRADMTPGVYEGERYDGVMRDIVGNHVALVEDGRAGPDVVVGDSTEGLNTMKLSRKAALLQGASLAYLAPKLAQDSKIDLTPVFASINAKNYKANKTKIAADVAKLTVGKLAADASIEDYNGLLDTLDEVNPAEDTETVTPPNAAAPVKPKVDPTAKDAGPGEQIRAIMRDKLEESDIAKIEELLKSLEKAEEGERQAAATDEGAASGQEEKDMDMVTKPAMDAAIAAAVEAAKRDTIKTQRAISEALRAVHPHVGEIAMTFDSAEEVYSTALKMLGVNIDGVHPSAYPTILSYQRKAGGSQPASGLIAQDAAAKSDFEKRFPNAGRLLA